MIPRKKILREISEAYDSARSDGVARQRKQLIPLCFGSGTSLSYACAVSGTGQLVADGNRNILHSSQRAAMPCLGRVGNEKALFGLNRAFAIFRVGFVGV
jgi:hypothetical protein